MATFISMRARTTIENFLDSVKSRKPPVCDVEIGHRSATICHLGTSRFASARKVQRDPAAERIIGDDEAAAMVARPHRRALYDLSRRVLGA